MYCQNCRAQNPPDATLCQRCGSLALVDAQGQPAPGNPNQPGNAPWPGQQPPQQAPGASPWERPGSTTLPGAGQQPGYGGPGQPQPGYPGVGQPQPGYPGAGQPQAGYPGAGQQQRGYPGAGQQQPGYPGAGQQPGYGGPGQPQPGYPGAGQQPGYGGPGQPGYPGAGGPLPGYGGPGQPGRDGRPPGAKKSHTGRNVAIVIAILVVLAIGVGGLIAVVKLGSKLAALPSSSSSPYINYPTTPGTVVVESSIANDADAPFSLQTCTGSITTKTDASGNSTASLALTAVLKNTSMKTLATTRVWIVGLDDSGEEVDASAGEFSVFKDDDAVTIAAGDTYTSTGTFAKVSLDIKKIKCSPRRATFGDGSSWDPYKK